MDNGFSARTLVRPLLVVPRSVGTARGADGDSVHNQFDFYESNRVSHWSGSSYDGFANIDWGSAKQTAQWYLLLWLWKVSVAISYCKHAFPFASEKLSCASKTRMKNVPGGLKRSHAPSFNSFALHKISKGHTKLKLFFHVICSYT